MKTFFTALLLVSALPVFSQQLQGSEDMALLEVSVADMKNTPRNKDIIVFEGQNTKKKFQGITDANGKFQILIPEGDVYDIKIIGLGETDDYSTIRIDKQPGIIESGLQIQYEPAKSFTLNDVHFNTGQSSLRSDSYKPLNDLIEILKIKDQMVIEIGGHTDNVGNEDNNLKLSQARAETVRNYLIKKGINATRLKAKGYGETQPVAYNDTAEGRQQNRRTEVKILSE